MRKRVLGIKTPDGPSSNDPLDKYIEIDMNFDKNVTLPERLNFSKMAGLFNLDRSRLYEIRRRDLRFPKPDGGQWSVVAVGLLLVARDLEREGGQAELLADVLDGIERNT